MRLSLKRMDAQIIQIQADRQAEADREATEEYDEIIAELKLSARIWILRSISWTA